MEMKPFLQSVNASMILFFFYVQVPRADARIVWCGGDGGGGQPWQAAARQGARRQLQAAPLTLAS